MEFRKNTLKQDTLIFSIKNNAKSPMTIYNKMLRQFEYFQEKVGKAQRLKFVFAFSIFKSQYQKR